MSKKDSAKKNAARKAPPEPPAAHAPHGGNRHRRLAKRCGTCRWRRPRRPRPRAATRSWSPIQVRLGARVALTALVVTVALTGLATLLTSDFFRVSPQTTRISGNQRVTTEQIYAASGVNARNIFTVQGGAVAAAVRKMPGVAAATAHVSLPAQVYIEVREQEPLAIWQVLTANTLDRHRWRHDGGRW